MDIRKVKKLIELLERSEVDEIEVHEGEESVRIRRSPPVVAAPGVGVSYVADPAPAAAAAPRAPGAAPCAPEPIPAAAEPEESGHTVTSPMVGTFFAASSPGSRPFVNVGQRIEVGDTLCIIEAMKILNHVEADCAGVVIEVLAENGQPVEYGQPLFIVDIGA